MSSGTSVEQLLARWEKRRPGTPVRAVVERAEALGFTPVLPIGSSTPSYLRLVHGDATLYVNAQRLTAVGAAVRARTAPLPGARVGARDVQLPFEDTDPFAVLETVLFAGKAPSAPTLVQPDVTWPPVRVEAPAARRRHPVALTVAGVAVLLVLVVALVGGLSATTRTSATSAVSSAGAASSSAAARSAAQSSAAEAAASSADAALVDDDATTGPAPTSAGLATASLSDPAAASAVDGAQPATALAALAAVPVKGRAPKTGYTRDQFGAGWVDVDHNGCDTRNDVLARDLADKTFKPGTHDCVVLTGSLIDPYSGRTIAFRRGQGTSEAVQIDHVVALSDAWQTGAQGWDAARRTAFANDPLELLAVDGPLNEQKGDGDAATWLPPNTSIRCAYVARQLSVKLEYGLWMTPAERDAVATVLSACPLEPLAGGVVADLPARTTTAAPSTAARVAATPAPRSTAAPAPVPAPAPRPTPAPQPAPVPADTVYKNCDAVRAAGKAPLLRGQPGYSSKLDRDGDGIACER